MILHEERDIVGVSQLGGQVADDLIHWYANEFTPRLCRIVETPLWAMRGDHVRGVLGVSSGSRDMSLEVSAGSDRELTCFSASTCDVPIRGQNDR